MLHANGVGVEKDEAAAFNWYYRAAEQNYGSAQLRVAQMFAVGTGAPQDYKEAYFWLIRAALASVGRDVVRAEALRDQIVPHVGPKEQSEIEGRALNWTPPARQRP